jgi:hypothetical protein
METAQFTFSQQVQVYAMNWEGYAYRVLGFSGSTVSPFSETYENVNYAPRCEVQFKFRDAIRRKRPGQLSRWELLHQGNADPIPPDQLRREFKNYSGDFRLLGTTLVAKVSLMTKRLKRRRGSG